MTNTFTESAESSSQQKMIGNVSKLNKSELVDLLDDINYVQAILRQLVPPLHSEPIEYDRWYQLALKIVEGDVKQDVTVLHTLVNRNQVGNWDNEGGSVKYD